MEPETTHGIVAALTRLALHGIYIIMGGVEFLYNSILGHLL